jgi:hypothetical protein
MPPVKSSDGMTNLQSPITTDIFLKMTHIPAVVRNFFKRAQSSSVGSGTHRLKASFIYSRTKVAIPAAIAAATELPDLRITGASFKHDGQYDNISSPGTAKLSDPGFSKGLLGHYSRATFRRG